jgi:protein TonB
MFNKLVASEGRKTKALSPTTFIVSVLAHVGLLWGAVYAAENTEVGRKMKEEVVAYMEIEPEKAPEPEVKPEEPPPPPPEPEEAPPPVAKGFQDLVPPVEPPKEIPDVDLNAKAVDVNDFSGVGTAGGTSEGVSGGIAQNMANKEENTGNAPIDVSLAEEKPELRNRSEVARLLQRLYPPLLRDAGITGNAVMKFVVNAQGRVEGSSTSVVSSTHDAFGEAATKVVEKMQFKPAKVGGRPVPVLVTIPITFTLER